VNPHVFPNNAAETAARMKSRPFYSRLYFWVLAGMALGILTGIVFPEHKDQPGSFSAAQFKPLFDTFLKLIRMVIAPIIFTTVTVGIARLGDLKRVGRIGLKSLLYFEVMTTFALALGWIVVKVVQPGAGMNKNPANLDITSIQDRLSLASKHQNWMEFLLNIIPDTFVGAFARGEILQVLLLSVLFGIALNRLSETSHSVVNALDQVCKALMLMVGMIVKLAPLAVFGAISSTIAKEGVSSLLSLGKLLMCVYGTCLCFVILVLGSLLRLSGLSLWKFLRYIRQELFIVFGAASSEPVLPRMMVKLENLGCSKALVGLVLPSGYAFNLDGSSIYLTMGALFIAQATNTHLTFGQELAVLVVCLITSKGAAAVAGSAFIALAATLASMKTIPVEGMILTVGVDWFMAIARASTNVVGNGVATVVIAKWENEFDQQRALAVLNQPADELREADVKIEPTAPTASHGSDVEEKGTVQPASPKELSRR
jgi:aerobic C4-dicarboxylate transport protein